MIPYTGELHVFSEVGVAQHLPTHRFASYTTFIDRDFLGAGVHFDHPGGEAVPEASCEVWWYRIYVVQNDVR
jgi:hypothetical protein